MALVDQPPGTLGTPRVSGIPGPTTTTSKGPGPAPVGVGLGGIGAGDPVTTVVPIPASVLRQANRRAVHLLPSLQRQFGGVPLPLRSNHYDAVATLVAKLDTENSPVKLAASTFLNDLVDADDAQVTAEREAAAAAAAAQRRQSVASQASSRVMSPVERVLSPTSPRSPRRSLDHSGIPGPRLTTPTFGTSAASPSVTGRFPRPSPLGSGHSRNGSAASTHSQLPQLKPVPLTKRRPSSDPPQPLQEMQPNAPLTPQRAPPRRKVGAHHAAYARLIEQQEQQAQQQKAYTPSRIGRPTSIAYGASFGTPSHIPTPGRPVSQLDHSPSQLPRPSSQLDSHGSHIPRPSSQLDSHGSHIQAPTRPVSAFVSTAPVRRDTPPKETAPVRPSFESTSSTSSAASVGAGSAASASAASVSSGSDYSGHSRSRSYLGTIGESAVPERWAHLPDPDTHLLLPDRPTAAARARMIELGAILSHFEVVRARMETYRDELDAVRSQLRPAIDSLSSSGSSYATPTATPAQSYSRRSSMERSSIDDTPTRPSSISAGARERTWI